MGYINMKCSELNPLYFLSICSVQIRSRNGDKWENVLPMAVHDINSLLAIFARLIVDESETAGLIGATIATQVNTLDTAKLLKQLLEIVLSRSR